MWDAPFLNPPQLFSKQNIIVSGFCSMGGRCLWSKSTPSPHIGTYIHVYWPWHCTRPHIVYYTEHSSFLFEQVQDTLRWCCVHRKTMATYILSIHTWYWYRVCAYIHVCVYGHKISRFSLNIHVLQNNTTIYYDMHMKPCIHTSIALYMILHMFIS